MPGILELQTFLEALSRLRRNKGLHFCPQGIFLQRKKQAKCTKKITDRTYIKKYTLTRVDNVCNAGVIESMNVRLGDSEKAP